jgi:hypothetical protein
VSRNYYLDIGGIAKLVGTFPLISSQEEAPTESIGGIS